ncbi:hypothetical protein BAUCODRAFT_125428 [Baudoinia panamericana UAMH 10762]|uniref:F-box domain-containing protein n=1 Tax=Baudoinia panamericana (strain UAMH 10762) TaxID=717646 RepID=M2N3K3_BAUPA|nr:uncharacterized protein BAUCODRAFT_125428 [Baudoinia panamericana UAMH 10762]EMC93579.1 hypothetical protein BAUCODRAFT_125428 [Baudoinia panamericana UAMH 10762]
MANIETQLSEPGTDVLTAPDDLADSEPSRKRPKTTQYEHYMNAESCRKRANACLDKLACCDNGKQDLVCAAQDELENQRRALDGLLAHISPQARHSPESAVLMEKVFNTPELLEHILYQLSNFELMVAMQVNKVFFNAIEGSVKLQRQLGLKDDPDSLIYFPTHDFWFSDLFCSTHAVERVAGEPIHNLLRVHCAVDSFAGDMRVGDRARSMLICQPPLKIVEAYCSCCSGPRVWRHSRLRTSNSHPPAAVFRSSRGATVGDILDLTKRLKEEHKMCPDASSFDHNQQGFVNVHVCFEALVEAKENDPLFVRERDRFEEERKKHTERLARQRHIDAYAAAKRNARDSGQPIPTLAEFEAANATNAT